MYFQSPFRRCANERVISLCWWITSFKALLADKEDAALDRVFRAGRYWVPQWYRSTHPIAYWDVFSHPEKPAKYAPGVGAPENWWFDSNKAAKLEQAK